MTIYSKGINELDSVNVGAVFLSVTSTEEEKKKLLRVIIIDIDTQPMFLSINLEREEVMKDIPLETLSDMMPPRVYEVNLVIPVGQTATGLLTPQVAGSQGSIDGWYEYEIVE